MPSSQSHSEVNHKFRATWLERVKYKKRAQRKTYMLTSSPIVFEAIKPASQWIGCLIDWSKTFMDDTPGRTCLSFSVWITSQANPLARCLDRQLMKRIKRETERIQGGISCPRTHWSTQITSLQPASQLAGWWIENRERWRSDRGGLTYPTLEQSNPRASVQPATWLAGWWIKSREIWWPDWGKLTCHPLDPLNPKPSI